MIILTWCLLLPCFTVHTLCYSNMATFLEDPYRLDKDADERTDGRDEDDDGETQEDLLEKEKLSTDRDYYAILNLDRTAGEDDIKNAYRRLALTFHPDKHTNRPEDKLAAEAKFAIIQKAHDVLSDPVKRHIYDTYGPDAAEMSWEIGSRGQSPEEIRAEYERQHRKRQELAADSMVKSKGEIHLSLDASQIFDPDVRRSRIRRHLPLGRFEPVENPTRGLADILQWPEVTQASVKHAWEVGSTRARMSTL